MDENDDIHLMALPKINDKNSNGYQGLGFVSDVSFIYRDQCKHHIL